VGTAGLAAVESGSAVQVEAGATPLYGLDATAGVLEVRSAEADSAKPVLIYQVDAGNLSTIRQEGTVGVAHGRADALLTFARLNTDNDEPAAKVHEVTWSGDAGYRISGNTGLRATLREDVAAAPLPSPFAFYQVVQETRLARQNVYGGATFETTTASGWHNLLRYGLVRSRAQAFDFGGPSTGVPMTIQSANGYPASGVATFLSQPGREDFVTNRDEGTYQTDGRWKFLRLGGGGRYEDERGADLVTGGTAARLERSHLDAAATVQAEWKHRLFGEASGFVDHESTLGWHGGPRLGATYVPVRPGARKFRGTTLRATAATGTREPSVVETAQVGTTIAANGLPRSRTYSAGVEQELLPRRVSLKVTYFHGQCAHEFETLGLAPLRLGDQLAYRTQGLEASMQWRPAPRLLVAGGYTYLAALVERSAAVGVMNPNVPGVLIGAATGLAGARPFDRAPNTGFVEAEYAGRLVSAGLKATMQGRSDETTGLVLNPTLLLPNRNLSPGYAEVDAQMGVQVTHAIRLYAQATNLANDRHVAPIGYLSTPFAVSVGVRVRLGRE
jgi:iron complex outermembrane receptor protein/vitamin B12 transporter